MKTNKKIKLLSLASALIVVMAFTACKGSEKEEKIDENFPNFELTSKSVEAKKKNDDVVGWIKVPGTDIDDAVLYSKDNDNYQRTKLDGTWDYFGEYFTDMDNVKIKDGTKEGLDLHTVVYGHNVYNGVKNLTEWKGHKIPDYGVDKVPVDFKDGEKFAQLFRYNSKEFAEANPYIYFSTDKEEMVWEIFSAYYTDINSFNRWNGYETMATKEGMMNVVSDSLAKSVFNFNVDVTEDDKILTLSTCSYIEGAENKDLRFHIVAKLVEPGDKFKEKATITKNERKIDMRETALKTPVKPQQRAA